MRPPLVLSAQLTDEPERLSAQVWIPNEAVPVFLLHLYILRHEREYFTVVLQGATLIRVRVGYEPEKRPHGWVEWSSSGPLMLVATDDLNSWIYHLRPHFYEDRSRMAFELRMVADDSNTGKRLGLDLAIGQPPSKKARR